MKKVCKNCNAVVEDDAIFCVNCGSEEIMEIEEAQPTCQAGKKCNKKLCTVFGIIGIVILAVILVLAFIGKEPYDDAIKLYENIFNGKVDGIEKLAPEEIWTMLGDNAEETKDEIKDEFGSVKEVAGAVFGDDFACEVEVLRETKIADNVMEKLKACVEKTYGIKADRIGDGYDLVLKVTYSGSEYISVKSGNSPVIEIDGNWYIISYYESTDGYELYFAPRSF